MGVRNLPVILTVPDMARRLTISRQMAYKLSNDGQMHCYRAGTAIRVSRDRSPLA